MKRRILQTLLKPWISNSSAATAIEYALMASAIAIAIAGVVYALGDELINFFNMLGGIVQNAA